MTIKQKFSWQLYHYYLCGYPENSMIHDSKKRLTYDNPQNDQVPHHSHEKHAPKKDIPDDASSQVHSSRARIFQLIILNLCQLGILPKNLEDVRLKIRDIWVVGHVDFVSLSLIWLIATFWPWLYGKVAQSSLTRDQHRSVGRADVAPPLLLDFREE